MSVYFYLMTDGIPPEEVENHPPYVTGEEAVETAEREAARTRSRIQIFRGFDEGVTSQPWRVVDPPQV